MEKKLLARFEVGNRVFEVSGSYKIEKNIDINNEEYFYPEFSNLSSIEVVNGKLISFEPTGNSFDGRKFIVDDMVNAFFSSLIRNGDKYKSLYLDSGLQELVDEYTKDIVLTLEGKGIPRRILYADTYSYELLFVTDKYIYYNYDESTLMISVDNHNIISDNYFAEVGLFDSFDSVKDGTETLLWGEIPKEYEEE